jgi:hypothetical protein
MASAFTVILTLAAIVTQTIPARGDVVQSGREEIFVIIGDPANAEPVQLEGEIHFTLRETELRDGTIRSVYQISAHGIGLGLWSRTPYQFNETYTYTWIDPPGLQFHIHSDDIMRLISRGARPNVMIAQSMSVIRDANGVYSFEFAFDYDITGRHN